jgi:hypothetical protein
MSPLAPDQLAILRVLARHGVEFVVVGGVAAQIHGWRGAFGSAFKTRYGRLELVLRAHAIGDYAFTKLPAVMQLSCPRLQDRCGKPDWFPCAQSGWVARGNTPG